MLFGIVLVAVGSGVYFNTHVGVSPYDAVGLVAAAKLGHENIYRFVRIGTDLLCVAAGVLMGSKIGLGTVLMTFFTGPLFSFFRGRFLVWGQKRRLITW
jgi:uncharacterized membrane protein YczE